MGQSFPNEVPRATLEDRLLFNYKRKTAPSDPSDKETWYDTDDEELKIYDAGTASWNKTGVVSHTALQDVASDQHHNPVSVSGPLTSDGSQGLDLSFGDGLAVSNGSLVAALGTGLAIDGSGNIHVPADAVGVTELDYKAPLGSTNGALDLALGDAVSTDANGNLYVPADAIGASHIASGAVGTTQLAADAATGTEIAADAVGSGQIASGAVGATQISTDAVGVDEIDYKAPLGATNRSLDLALGNALTTDANGNLAVASGAIGTPELSYNAPLTASSGSLDVSVGNALTVSSGSLAVQSGGIATSELAGDAVTATKVNDGETLPVSISGDADTVDGQHATELKEQALAYEMVL